MAEKKFMQKMFSKNKGALHREMHVKEGDKIPSGKLEKAEHSKNPKLRKRAVAAEIGRKYGGGKRK